MENGFPQNRPIFCPTIQSQLMAGCLIQCFQPTQHCQFLLSFPQTYINRDPLRHCQSRTEQKVAGRDVWSAAVREGTWGSKRRVQAHFPSISLETPRHCVSHKLFKWKAVPRVRKGDNTSSLLTPCSAGPGSARRVLSSLKSPCAKRE